MISDLKLDLSQQNILSLLIPKESEIKEIYLDEIKLKGPKTLGQIYLTQPNTNEKTIIITPDGAIKNGIPDDSTAKDVIIRRNSNSEIKSANPKAKRQIAII